MLKYEIKLQIAFEALSQFKLNIINYINFKVIK